LGAEQAFNVRNNNFDDYNSIPAPNVTLHCIYGYGLPTPGTYHFSNDNFTEISGVTWVDGDTVVPSESSTWCKNWKENQTEPVIMKGFFNASHSYLPFYPAIVKYIHNITKQKI